MSTARVADAASANLLHWIEQNGAQLSQVHIVPLGGGERGIFVLGDIPPGEQLFRLPLRCLITLPDARASEMGRLLDAHIQVADPNLYLVAFLLEEKARGEASFWKPFLEVLPQSFPTHPFYFQEGDLSLLKGSFLRELILFQRKVVENEYAHLCQHVPGFARFTFEEFAWAHFAVLTRIFGPKLNGIQINCLAPFADMINDGRPWNIQWGWSTDGQFFELKSARAIPRGTELHTSYGANSNLHLLLHYGFVHEHNPDNEVMLPLEMPSGDPLLAEKQQLLGITTPSAQQAFSLPLKPDASVLNELFSELRIVHAQAEELAVLKAAPDALARAKTPLSPGNEARVLRALAEACMARLAGYETSLEEDTRLLQEGNLSPNARNCILLRQGEKQILKFYSQASS